MTILLTNYMKGKRMNLKTKLDLPLNAAASILSTPSGKTTDFKPSAACLEAHSSGVLCFNADETPRYIPTFLKTKAQFFN